jgi:hypothetical protein
LCVRPIFLSQHDSDPKKGQSEACNCPEYGNSRAESVITKEEQQDPSNDKGSENHFRNNQGEKCELPVSLIMIHLRFFLILSDNRSTLTLITLGAG